MCWNDDKTPWILETLNNVQYVVLPQGCAIAAYFTNVSAICCYWTGTFLLLTAVLGLGCKRILTPNQHFWFKQTFFRLFVLLLFFYVMNNIRLQPLDGSIHLGKAPTMEAFKFHLATGLLLVHSHTYMVTRDAPPLSHIQTIHHKHKKTSSRAHTCM